MLKVSLFLLLGVTNVLAPAEAAARSMAEAPLVESVARISLTVSDLDRALSFYTQVLPFELESQTELAGDDVEHMTGVFGARVRWARLRLGGEQIELHDYLAPEGSAIPPDSRSNDLWFQHIAIVVRDMDQAYAHLRGHRVQHASTGPQTLPEWNPNAGGIRAFYFKDPDGHVLEVIWFPPGKGDPRWQAPSDRLFLGIDHTAIVVSDSEASLDFYRDLLGLSVAGNSENYGSEQEHLNNVFGARLWITGTKAPAGGPGVEFLEYLAPRDGRPRPAIRANDLAHWQTVLTVADLDAVAARLREVPWVSPGVVDLQTDPFGVDRGLLVRDPDGHAVLLIEEAIEKEIP